MSNKKEMGGAFESNPQDQKPMSFENFISTQRPVNDEGGNERVLTEDEKIEVYSAYVEDFYKKEGKLGKLYSVYVKYFYTSGASNAYDKETNSKPMEFDEFKRLNNEESSGSSEQSPQMISFRDFMDTVEIKNSNN